MCEVADESKHTHTYIYTHTHTYTHTHKPSTVALAAHAHRGLIVSEASTLTKSMASLSIYTRKCYSVGRANVSATYAVLNYCANVPFDPQ